MFLDGSIIISLTLVFWGFEMRFREHDLKGIVLKFVTAQPQISIQKDVSLPRQNAERDPDLRLDSFRDPCRSNNLWSRLIHSCAESFKLHPGKYDVRIGASGQSVRACFDKDILRILC